MSEKIKCPICKKRLFDTKSSTTGEIEIKCTKCNNIVTVKFKAS